MIFLICSFIILFVLMFFYQKLFFEKDNQKTFIIKIIACLVFLSIGIYSMFTNDEYHYTQTMILIGLFMCACGDVLIGLRRIIPNKKQLFFLLGLTTFFIAHNFYGISLAIRYSGDYIFAIAIILFLFIGFVFLLQNTKIEFGKMRIPCYIYILSSSIMFTISLITFIMTVNVGNLVMFLGIVLFIISDSFLCYTYFKKQLEHPKLIKCISVFTYFSGQALIALSLYLY